MSFDKPFKKEVVEVKYSENDDSQIASRETFDEINSRSIIEELHENSTNYSTQSNSVLSVPPTTPASNFTFDHYFPSVRQPFRSLTEAKLPYVRELGVKTCIDRLGDYFNCKDHKLNLVQFWFLDVLTDCLWLCQDEFHFPEGHQKAIIEWILYAFDLIQDPCKNLSRKEFFQIFNEALVIAGEQVQAGRELLPLPAGLFELRENGRGEKISFSSISTEQSSSVSLMSHRTCGGSYVAVGIDENIEIFKLPKATRPCYKPTTDDTVISESINEASLPLQEEEFFSSQSSEFYKPNLNTPERFKSCSQSSSLSDEELDTFYEKKFYWKSSGSDRENRIKASEVVNVDAFLSNTNIPSTNNVREEWNNYLKEREDYVNSLEAHILINTCALVVIKSFVYDYFYDTFQYIIIKLALINQFTAITNTINTIWNIPKILRDELKKPKAPKAKRVKKAKKKKPKKKAKRKKRPKRGTKKKKPKARAKPKKKKLTAQEKAELTRLKREQKLLEEERRRIAENRVLLLPLKDATDDDFFKSVFENWVRPKQGKHKLAKKKRKAKS